MRREKGSVLCGGSGIEGSVDCERDDWLEYGIWDCGKVRLVDGNDGDDGVFGLKVVGVYEGMLG